VYEKDQERVKLPSMFFKFTNLFLIALVGYSLSGCREVKSFYSNDQVVTPEDSAIVGGGPAGPGLAMSVVGVYDFDTRELCTGTLISTRIVLTAAHCIRSVENNIQVLFGTDLSNGTALGINATAIKIHPLYSKNKNRFSERYDIALIKLEDDPPDYFRPMSLPTKEMAISKMDTTFLVGYGKTQYTANDSRTLRMTFLNGITSEPGKLEFIINRVEGRGTCKGDSGGPALIERNGKLILMGLDSIGIFEVDLRTLRPLQDPCNVPVLFTNVVYFLDWIRQESRAL
jgi:secreted trypsin-like serine protease